MLECNDDRPLAERVAQGDAFLAALCPTDAGRPLAEGFQPVQEELRLALHEKQRAGFAATEAFKVRDAADERLDGTITELSLAALELSGGDTRDPLFFKLFPEGPQAVTCVGVEEEIGLVRQLLQQLEGHPLQTAFHSRLQARLAAVEHAEAELDQALRAEAEAWASCRRAEVDWLLRMRATRAAVERILRDLGRHDLVAQLSQLFPEGTETGQG